MTLFVKQPFLNQPLIKNTLAKSCTLFVLVASPLCMPAWAFAIATPTKDSQLDALTKPVLVENTATPKKPETPTIPHDPALNVITTATIQGKSLTLPIALLNKISEAGINPTDISILVQPLKPETDQAATPILNHQPHAIRTPASTQKLIPTLIAVDTLGADFTWHTKIFQKGFSVGDTLHGDIIIQGSGDPRLNHERLHALLGELVAKGIKHIDGDIVLDNRIFENVNFNPAAFDGQGLRAYNAPPNGLLINFGTVQVDFTPSGTLPLMTDNASLPLQNQPKSGNEAENMESSQTSQPLFNPNPTANSVAVKLLPPLADYTAPSVLPVSMAECGKVPFVKPSVSKDSLNFTGQVTASCGKQSWWFTFPDSNSLVKKSIKGTWLQYDPTFKGQVRFVGEANTSPKTMLNTLSLPLPIVSYPSVPLSSQIWDINHFSNNVMTEQVTLSLPVYAGGQATSSYPKAFDFIHHWWQTHLPNTKPPVMTRGSGLCRDCQVEPASMLALLNYAYQSPNFEVFKNSMGIAGVSGTMKALKKRQPDSPAIGKAWIKTGTLNDVSSMVGYVQGQSGQWYAVVGMANTPNAGHDYRVKAILDEMLAWTAVQ